MKNLRAYLIISCVLVTTLLCASKVQAQEFHELRTGVKSIVEKKLDSTDPSKEVIYRTKEYDDTGRMVYIKNSSDDVRFTYAADGTITIVGTSDLGPCKMIKKIERIDDGEVRIYEYVPEGADACFLRLTMDSEVQYTQNAVLDEIPKTVEIAAPFTKVTIYRSGDEQDLKITYAADKASGTATIQTVVTTELSMGNEERKSYGYSSYSGSFFFDGVATFDKNNWYLDGEYRHLYEYDEQNNWIKLTKQLRDESGISTTYYVREIVYY